MRTCRVAQKSLHNNKYLLDHFMTVCSPILASVVAANALLLADLMRISLLNCFHKKEAHLVEVPVIASGKGVSFSIAMAI